MKINNKEYFTNFGEFYTTSYPGYENLIVKPEVGILERHIGLLKDIYDDLYAISSLCVIGDNYGGFVPINCADKFNNIFVYSNKINIDIESTFKNYKNIEYTTTFYPCKFIYVHDLSLLNQDIIQQIKDNECIVLSKNSELFSFYEFNYELIKKSTHEFNNYTLYLPSYLNDDFLSYFHYYFTSESEFNYDNLIHLCIMVKNGGELFEKVLTENLSIIDRWTVLDTGSTDGTQDTVRKVFSNKKGNLYEEPFVNFRDSRNACLNLAGKNCKYTLMVDDTYVVQGELREFLNTVRGDQFANSYSLIIKSDDTEYYSNRVIKTQDELRYIYKMHEVIQKDNNVNVVIPNKEAWIIDYRADYMEKRTMDRKYYDLQLLFEEIEENPDDSRHYYYIAQTYNLLDNHEKAAEYFLKRAHHPVEGFKQEKVDSMFEAARIYNFKLNKPWEECEKMYLQAYEWEPTRPDALYFLGIHYYLEGEFKKAYPYMKKAFEIGYPLHTQFSLKPTLSYYFLPKFLAHLSYTENDITTGLECSKLFLDKNTNTQDPEYENMVSWYKIFQHLQVLYTLKNNIGNIQPENKDNIICFIVDGGYTKWSGKDILTKGVGGSETWAIETSRYIKKNFPSNRVVVFCNCEKNEVFENVEYLSLQHLYEFIIFNKVNTCIVSRFTEYIPLLYNSNTEKVVLVLHDISPIGNVIPLNPKLKHVVCLSDWHKKVFLNKFSNLESITSVHHYGIDKTKFNTVNNEKMPYSFIYSSFPNRGLVILLRMWDKIKEKIPQATLDIYCDVYGEWVIKNYPDEMKEIQNYLWDENGVEKYYSKGIRYHRWVDKNTLAQAWKRSDVWFYPCKFEETFCLTALEAASTYTLAITNNLAALQTTVGDRGVIIEGDVTTSEWQEKALERICEIFKNKTQKEELVRKNYEWCEHYTWENKAIEFMEKYIETNTENIEDQEIKNHYWSPIESVIKYFENKTKFDKNIIELGPGIIPFKHANYLVDKFDNNFETNKTQLKLDVDKEKFTDFKDGYFEFGYARHIFEDLTNPEFAFNEFVRICNEGYIETPSPLIEITRGVDSSMKEINSKLYRGYRHHKYIVWTSNKDNTIHFLPKFPIIEHLEFDKEYENKLKDLANNDRFLWNNYYIFNYEKKPKCIYHNVYGEDFSEYKNLIMKAVNDSIINTISFINEINNVTNQNDVDKRLNYADMYNWTNDLPYNCNARSTFEKVLRIFQDKRCEILEIGTYAGTSVIEMLKLLPNARAVVIDRWESYDEKIDNEIIQSIRNIEENKVEKIFYDNVRVSGMEGRIQAYKGDSKDVLMYQLNDMRFDFIYVDGSHLCLDTYLDLVLSWKLLRGDGIMAIDDYLFKKSDNCNELDRPYEAVEHFMRKYEGDFEIIDQGYRVFLKKIK